MSLSKIIDSLLSGDLERGQALQQIESLRTQNSEKMDFARVDHSRAHRRGFPEVIYGPGKTKEQLLKIFSSLAQKNPNVLATRVDEETARYVQREEQDAEYDLESRLLYRWREKEKRSEHQVAVVSAGTSDGPVAREATLAAEIMGNHVEDYRDVGVAGLHRLLEVIDSIRKAKTIICIAGFEAALPSVVAGLVHRPVIAVPTSVGYGASSGGVAALLGCLSSCSAGVLTVNIDNGFGAAYAATLMNRPFMSED